MKEVPILARRLKDLRDKHDLYQKDVAEKIGVKGNTLSGYENGTRSPDPKMLIELAKLYNVTTDYLLGYSDDPDGYEGIGDDEELIDFITNVKRWYKEAPKDRKEDLQRLFRMFEEYMKDDEWHHELTPCFFMVSFLLWY